MNAQRIAVVFSALLAASQLSIAGTIWANQADYGPHHLQLLDTSNGTVLKDFVLPFNGRGVVQVGNTLYVTNADNNQVTKYDATTGASLGTAFSVAGSTALSTIAYNGTNFWIGDYSGTNNAYLYTPTGTLLSTIRLQNCTGYCDGLEYFNGKLISNREDDGYPAVYDIYDLSGNLLQAAFISPDTDATGIAFDGTNFYVSLLLTKKIGIYSGTTGAFISSFADQGTNPYGIEDLSFDYASRSDTGTPEPATWATLAAGLGLIGTLAKKRARNV